MVIPDHNVAYTDINNYDPHVNKWEVRRSFIFCGTLVIIVIPGKNEFNYGREIYFFYIS